METDRYARSYGYRYDEMAKYESAAQIAKRIRNDIKAAKAEGLLPAVVDGTKVTYSVRSASGRSTCSIDVRVKGWPEPYMDDDRYGDDPWGNPRRRLTPAAEAAKMTLDRIHGAYNHDGSDVQTDYFDVNYYGHVEFENAEGWTER